MAAEVTGPSGLPSYLKAAGPRRSCALIPFLVLLPGSAGLLRTFRQALAILKWGIHRNKSGFLKSATRYTQGLLDY